MQLSDDQWDKIKDALPGKKTDRGRTGSNNRLFVEAVYWIGRNGGRWRSLPKEYGNWATTHKRFKGYGKGSLIRLLLMLTRNG